MSYSNIDDIGKRYKFQTDLQIIGDKEGLFLTSYQKSSEHIASRIISSIGMVSVLEICCGVGGTTVFLAQKLKHVYAIDINLNRLSSAKVNARTFGVDDKISFILSDGLDKEMMLTARADGVEAIITDVEWRADVLLPLTDTVSDINKTIPSTIELYKKINRYIGKNIVMHLPSTADKDQIKSLGRCEIEEMIYNEKIKFLNVYFGDLIIKEGTTQFIMN